MILAPQLQLERMVIFISQDWHLAIFSGLQIVMYQAFLAKLSASGESQWVAFPDGLGSRSPKLDASVPGSIYLAGANDSDTEDYVNQGDVDVGLVKYSANGEHVWSRFLGTPSFERARDVVVSGDSVYITGNFDIDYDGYRVGKWWWIYY